MLCGICMILDPQSSVIGSLERLSLDEIIVSSANPNVFIQLRMHCNNLISHVKVTTLFGINFIESVFIAV
jgi:hypothetical protein